MKRIQFDRISFDGSRLSQSDLEEWYDKDNELSNAIKKRLEKICPTQENVKALLKEITEKVHDFLLYSPEKLAQYVETKKELSGVFMDSSSGESTDFGKQVLDAFNYSNYRKKKLVELAKKLNVKSCPYCNMHYTLYAEEGEQESEKLAKFQFDHFFSKSKYPMLSMSLYNLIPSCALCNQGKSKRNLTLSFHPYHSDICKQFKFELDNPIDLYCGRKTYDYIDVNLKAVGSNQEELDEFVKTFHLKALYQRHGDVAQEVFDKAYQYYYYSHADNFVELLGQTSSDYILRLWMGTYPNEKDIEKRPMTKFIQDLWEQARRIHLFQQQH